MKNYFPLDIAFEEAFFDRDTERQRLKQNILSNTHTLITSPRRYGKTSLVLKTISELNNVGIGQMDMMIASDGERIKNVILDGVGKAAASIAIGRTKVVTLIKKIFQPFNTIETIEYKGLTLRFHPYSGKAPHLVILEALERLEELAIQTKSRVVLFFDEYQHVLGIKDALEFEISLRSFAQKAKQVVCIFSGSNRHMLQAVFSDQNRPFYNMCDHILLNRISEKDYIFHLLKLSKERWNKVLPESVIKLILDITACHSYYVNAVCRRLWSLDTLPDNDTVMMEWKCLASEKRYEISNDFEKISPIQRTILIELAREPFSHPTSKEVIKRLNASLSGVANAVEGLIDKDYIYQEEQQGVYRVLNPLMEYILRQETLGMGF